MDGEQSTDLRLILRRDQQRATTEREHRARLRVLVAHQFCAEAGGPGFPGDQLALQDRRSEIDANDAVHCTNVP